MMGEVPKAVEKETDGKEMYVEAQGSDGQKDEGQDEEGFGEDDEPAAVVKSETEIDAGGDSKQDGEEADGGVVREPDAQSDEG